MERVEIEGVLARRAEDRRASRLPPSHRARIRRRVRAEGASLVPTRPRRRGERRSSRTSPILASLSARLSVSIPKDAPRRLTTPPISDAFELHPDVASYGQTPSGVLPLRRGGAHVHAHLPPFLSRGGVVSRTAGDAERAEASVRRERVQRHILRVPRDPERRHRERADVVVAGVQRGRLHHPSVSQR